MNRAAVALSLMVGVVATGACSSSTKHAATTTAAPATTAAATSPSATDVHPGGALVTTIPGTTIPGVSTAATTGGATGTSTAAAPPGAVIASKAFTVGVQLVQWETTESIWRMHFLAKGKSCSDELASVTPAVGIDFDTGSQTALPATGSPITNVGVVFQADNSRNLPPFTQNSDFTLTLDHVDATPGGHWTGKVNVTPFTDDSNNTYSINIAIDATVCPPGQL